MDGLDRLAILLYGRKAKPQDFIGGSDARILSDAADRITALLNQEAGRKAYQDILAILDACQGGEGALDFIRAQVYQKLQGGVFIVDKGLTRSMCCEKSINGEICSECEVYTNMENFVDPRRAPWRME